MDYEDTKKHVHEKVLNVKSWPQENRLFKQRSRKQLKKPGPPLVPGFTDQQVIFVPASIFAWPLLWKD